MELEIVQKGHRLYSQAIAPVFASQNFDQSVTGVSGETILFSTVIPANTLGPNGVLRLSILCRTDGVLSNSKSWRVRFGSTLFASVGVTTINLLNTITRIANRNSTSAQVSNKYLHVMQGVAGTLESNMTGAVDTTVDQYLTITGQTTVEPTKSATITRSGSTATAAVTAHGYVSGDSVLMAGANEAEYNGTFVIFNVTANTFDYTVTGSPATPATGTITSARWTKMTLESVLVEVVK
ncbi:MAG: hypothetical protein A3J24_06350 [Deltaproteobacteria bacterium RIFCSPLOWO2_02_FULL_53_8]|nr:MAG: hypothetical protein A3J24_06350 [Deltaproteobacteria bacterium RIFCSPLOWO2_02_FULL_53_8]